MANSAPTTGGAADAAPSRPQPGNEDPNFSPVDWLREWQSAGGWYGWNDGNAFIVGTLANHPREAQRRLWSQLDAKPRRRDAVRKAVRDRCEL